MAVRIAETEKSFFKKVNKAKKMGVGTAVSRPNDSEGLKNKDFEK